MPYSQFTLQKVVEDFNLTLAEKEEFLVSSLEIAPSPYLAEFINRNLHLAIALNTEKARSELLICPLLLAVKEEFNNQISLFSGEEFNVDPELGFNGICDFIISLSPEQLFIKAPVMVIIEAKKEDLKGGLGQCVAAMVAAEKFNEQFHNPITKIYGAVTTGTIWRFLQLERQTLTIYLSEYFLPPLEAILGRLVAIIQAEIADAD